MDIWMHACMNCHHFEYKFLNIGIDERAENYANLYESQQEQVKGGRS